MDRVNNYLSQPVFNDYQVYLAGTDPATATNVQNMSTDENFVKANGIKIISGRDFHLYDSGKVLVNETVLRRLGLKPEKAPGTKLYTKFPGVPEFYREITGVMKDFNFNSLHESQHCPLKSINSPSRSFTKEVTLSTYSSKFIIGVLLE